MRHHHGGATQALTMLVLLSMHLFATLSHSAPVSGTNILDTAPVNFTTHVELLARAESEAQSSATTSLLAKRDFTVCNRATSAEIVATWRLSDEAKTFCMNHQDEKLGHAGQNPTTLYPLSLTSYVYDLNQNEHEISVSAANNNPDTDFTMGLDVCLNAFTNLVFTCTNIGTGGTIFVNNVFWSIDVDDAPANWQKRSLEETDTTTTERDVPTSVADGAKVVCNLPGPHSVFAGIVMHAITSFCFASEGTAVQHLFPLVDTQHYDDDVIELSISVIASGIDYTVDSHDCIPAMNDIVQSCGDGFGGKYSASWPVNPLVLLIMEVNVNGATTPAPFEDKLSPEASSADLESRQSNPAVACSVDQPRPYVSRNAVTAAFSQYCALNDGHYMKPGDQVNQLYPLDGGKFGHAIFGIRTVQNWPIQFSVCMSNFALILDGCDKHKAVGGVLTGLGSGVVYSINIHPSSNPKRSLDSAPVRDLIEAAPLLESRQDVTLDCRPNDAGFTANIGPVSTAIRQWCTESDGIEIEAGSTRVTSIGLNGGGSLLMGIHLLTDAGYVIDRGICLGIFLDIIFYCSPLAADYDDAVGGLLYGQGNSMYFQLYMNYPHFQGAVSKRVIENETPTLESRQDDDILDCRPNFAGSTANIGPVTSAIRDWCTNNDGVEIAPGSASVAYVNLDGGGFALIGIHMLTQDAGYVVSKDLCVGIFLNLIYFCSPLAADSDDAVGGLLYGQGRSLYYQLYINFPQFEGAFTISTLPPGSG
ncbi:hypothetical protein LTR56_004154 [Elasticomyces elasticus]|nr:hypothetical protein LTR22_015359 [Elasticomyces elasticus]KAK3654100.1 hypothetical protein LTR56_004154 [Elasticomyces elasticus]KAK4914678.1 hypothetical protein LTR49_017120 [Elasticomyces elasticus]KAK5753009.1 hypothetical protein LTS12_016885 [Elasticomyces elasticus]